MLRVFTALALLFFTLPAWAHDPEWVYVGTYTGRGSEGIYVSKLDMHTGKLTEPQLAAKVTSPSFLAVHPSRKYLYAVSEVETTEGKKGGGVTAYQIDSSTGKLTKLNAQLSGGAGPCHVSIDPSGNVCMVANYSGGSVASFAIKSDGTLKPAASFHQHEGTSANKQRQEAPHAHSINSDTLGLFAIAADLGTDELRSYRIDPASGKLTPAHITKTAPGGGPRHFAFHPNGKWAYTNLEMTSSVAALDYDGRGKLTVREMLSTLPQPTPGNSTAEIRVHPSGKFVYVSNRGHNSIARFAVQADGSLKASGHTSTMGKTPRNFGLVGDFLLVANQDSGNVVVFRIDPTTGDLTPTGSEVKVSMAVCVVGVVAK
jgi:6-phosphogluconolactonase